MSIPIRGPTPSLRPPATLPAVHCHSCSSQIHRLPPARPWRVISPRLLQHLPQTRGCCHPCKPLAVSAPQTCSAWRSSCMIQGSGQLCKTWFSRKRTNGLMIMLRLKPVLAMQTMALLSADLTWALYMIKVRLCPFYLSASTPASKSVLQAFLVLQCCCCNTV